jgi:hypothetical protein
MRWWENVDGCGTTIDQWMLETVAPLLLTLGQLDLIFDHPAVPEGEEIVTRADAIRHGLDRCIASFVLPENVLWWRLDPTGRRYRECLVQEIEEDETAEGLRIAYRHWTADSWTLFDQEGKVLAHDEHPFGRVPIMRAFDMRKPRARHVGLSRYEGIAERQKEYYNRDSELILSDTTQAHPLLQGPEDFIQADGTIPVGPSWLLPKKKNSFGGTATYEGFDVVVFPKEGAESIRRNKADLRDDVDRDAALVRPAGRDQRAQSGLSKLVDQADGNNRLAKIARSLAKVERQIAEMALCVLHDGSVSAKMLASIEITYPVEFDLYTAGDVARATADFQALAGKAGSLPTCESLMLGRMIRLCLPGLSDTQYATCEEEINRYVERRHEELKSEQPEAVSQTIRKDIFQDINVI